MILVYCFVIDRIEIEEKHFLEEVKNKLRDALGEIHHKVTSRARDPEA